MYVCMYLCQLTGLVSFFPRQIVYQRARQATSTSTLPQGSYPHPLCPVIPTLGPLHEDFNADEDIVSGYMPFMRLVYESFFQGRNLQTSQNPGEFNFV